MTLHHYKLTIEKKRSQLDVCDEFSQNFSTLESQFNDPQPSNIYKLFLNTSHRIITKIFYSAAALAHVFV